MQLTIILSFYFLFVDNFFILTMVVNMIKKVFCFFSDYFNLLWPELDSIAKYSS